MYYVKDTKDPNWLVVVKTKFGYWYDMPEEDINEVCQENSIINEDDSDENWLLFYIILQNKQALLLITLFFFNDLDLNEPYLLFYLFLSIYIYITIIYYIYIIV